MNLTRHNMVVPDTDATLLSKQELHTLAILLTGRAGTSNQRGGIRRILQTVKTDTPPPNPEYLPTAITNRVTTKFKADFLLLELVQKSRQADLINLSSTELS